MTENERKALMKKINRCGVHVRIVLSLAGIWPYEKSERKFKYCRWYTVVIIFIFNIIGIIGFIIHHRHNLNIMLTGFGIGLSLTCVVLKVMCFKYYGNNMVIINKMLLEMTNDQMNVKDEIWKILVQPMSYFTGVLYPKISCSGFSLVVVMWSRPTLAMLISYLKGNMTYARFYPTRYFWTVTPGSWIWLAHFCIELLASWFVVSVGVMGDNWYSFTISKICGHFRILNYEIKNLPAEEFTLSKIKHFHKRHQDLNILADLLGELAGPFIFVVTLSTAVMLCTTIFQISQMDVITIGKISWPLVYTSYKLVQIFIYAWGGELIKMESEAFREAVYSSAWPDTKNDKLVANSITMMMFQRPIILTACQIKPITAELFSGLVNTTLSYFFLLQTINEKS